MNDVKEKPILFSGEMVSAIFEGRKTQTRRIIKNQPVKDGLLWKLFGAGWSVGIYSVLCVPGHSLSNKNPYGRPGDRLWVRETWCECKCGAVSCQGFQYKADDQGGNSGWKWKPSIHMPRKACRLLLEIVSMRVERLNAISADDALAEGIDISNSAGMAPVVGRAWYTTRFRQLWESINGKDSWEKNPWVWAITFKPVML